VPRSAKAAPAVCGAKTTPPQVPLPLYIVKMQSEEIFRLTRSFLSGIGEYASASLSFVDPTFYLPKFFPNPRNFYLSNLEGTVNLLSCRATLNSNRVTEQHFGREHDAKA
jgi:hypothetical protein